MNSLFDKDYRYTEKALEISHKTEQALKELFKKYVQEEYSPREIAHVMQMCVTDFELDAVLSKKD